MKWLLKNAIAALCLFPANVLLIQLLALALRRRFPILTLRLIAGALLLLSLASMPGISSRLMTRIEGESQPLDLAEPKLAARADAIVVPGAGRRYGAPEYGGRDDVSKPGLERLRYAVDIHRATGLPILVSGGRPDRAGPSEAEDMARTLSESFGVHARWQETESINTAENAQLSFRILAPLGKKRIFLVTAAAHMPRARGSFEKAGFEVVPAPMDFEGAPSVEFTPLDWIPSSGGLAQSSNYLHEAIGSIWYAGWGM